jgi:predicted dehydrogenase
MNTKLKLGFIGGGTNSAIGPVHRIALGLDSKFELVCGCFSRDPEINAKSGSEYGIETERIYESSTAFFQKEKDKIDGVVILTPPESHKKYIKEALEHNLPIICEKALTEHPVDAFELFNSVQSKKGFLVVTFNYTGYPMVREMKYMIENKLIGKVQQIFAEMPQESFLRSEKSKKNSKLQPWRCTDKEIPTVSLDLGVHLQNIIYFLCGKKAKSVVSTQNNFGNIKDIIDDVSCIVDYEEDIKVHYWYGKTALGNTNGMRIRVFGEKGSLDWTQLYPDELKYFDNNGNRMVLDRSSNILEIACQPRYNRFKSGHPTGFLEAFANYYNDIYDALIAYKKQGTFNHPYLFDAGAAAEGLQLMYKINESAKNKSWAFL